MSLSLKVVVERHPDGFVAYPVGLVRGVIVGEGDCVEEAIADLRSAIAFHIETFGTEELEKAAKEEESIIPPWRRNIR